MLTALLGTLNRGGRFGSGAGIPGIAARITQGGSAVASCGKVQLTDSSGVAIGDPVTVNTSGIAAWTGLTPATYRVYSHPSYDKMLGASEPDYQMVVVGSGVATQDIVVQAASPFADNFQSYADSTALKDTSTGFGSSVGTPTFTEADGGTVTLDATGGPNSSKAMMYTWPDRTGTAGDSPTCGSFTVDARTFFDPKPNSATYYIRWMSKESLNFHNAHANCTGENKDYKFFLGWIDHTPSGLGEVYLGYVNGFDPFQLNFILYDGVHTSLEAASGSGCVYPAVAPTTCKHTLDASATHTNAWHVWCIALTGLGTVSATGIVYLDGERVMELGGDLSAFTGDFNFAQWGANMNSGPDQVQYRWFRECGIYTKRPALIDVVS